ncbi:MAG: hypothetical protein H6735_12495 [Alphaproteobacteria bacterium]|nr:hypothetical protein [Alphaproteobacteria bacterium]
MRFVAVPLALAAVGCAPAGDEDAPIRYRSTLTASTAGLVLHDDGETGHAGMFETNCPFETQGGDVTGDYDLPDHGEEVQDGGNSAMGPATVVLVLDSKVHLLEKSTGQYLVDKLLWEGVEEVRLYDEGLVGEVDDGPQGCAIEWRVDHALIASVALDGSVCGGAMDAGWDGTTVVGGQERLAFVTPAGATFVDTGADRLAWDDVTGLAYATADGEGEVRAWTPAGALAWSSQVDGRIHSLSQAGEQGAAVLSWEREDGSGVVSWLSGADGTVVAEIATPSAADAVRVSADGSVIALVRPDETYFYGVHDLR